MLKAILNTWSHFNLMAHSFFTWLRSGVSQQQRVLQPILVKQTVPYKKRVSRR
jgi:hypothetical protein